MGDLIDLSDPVPDPSEPPKQQAPPKPYTTAGKEYDFMKAIPPSNLLNSTKADPPNGKEGLRRFDSETQEEDEFHDAHS
jgi:hypothetical protein